MNTQRPCDSYEKLRWEVLVNTEYLTFLTRSRRIVMTIQALGVKYVYKLIASCLS